MLKKENLPNPDRDGVSDPSDPGGPDFRTPRFQSPLARKQLFFILLFSSIIILVGTSIQLYIEYQNDMGAIDLQLSQVKNGYLPSLTSSLWKLDDDQLKIQLGNMLSMRDVVRLEIYEKEKLTYSAGDLTPNARIILRSYDMRHTRIGGSEKIGTLHAMATLSRVHRRLGKRLMVILTTQGIKTFLVSLFILAIIHFMVTRHLHTMAGHVRRLDALNLGRPLALPRRIGVPDELDDVVGAINSMESRLNGYIREQDRTTNVLAESEDRLRRSQNLLKTVLSSLDEVVLLVEPQGRLIVDANATMDRIFGYQHNEVLGRGTGMLHVDERQFKRFEKNVEAAFRDQGFYATESEMRRKGGEIFATEHYVTKISGRSDIPEMEVSIIRDVSRRKKLESRVRQAQKLEAVGTLTGGIAHDFNNILGIIMGNAELAMAHIRRHQDGYRHLEEIITAGTRAKEVIGQLLNYGRITEHLLIPINLTGTVESTVKLLRTSIPSEIKLLQRFDKKIWTVKADPSQIHQVVLNLCTNACQAMESRGGRLTVHLTNTSLTQDRRNHAINLPTGPYVQLTVSDTGPGITADIMDKVFDPYFTTKETGKGTGLGLAVVHGIVKNHHGAVSLESRSGKGARISVYLPAVDLPARAEPSGATVKTVALPRGKAKILLVDDEPQLVQLGKAMLQRLGYEVETATRPEEAIDLVSAAPSRLDLLITDLSMPTMSGLELAAQIHTMEPDLPIILCSGISARVNPEVSRAAGIRHLLAKPYDLQKLAAILSATLGQGQPNPS